jgi:hypothetical protein
MAKRVMSDLDPAAIEAEIDRVVQLTNLPRPEIAAAMARLLGEDVSDIVYSEPPTEEVRERLGLNRPQSALDALQKRRAAARASSS